MRFYTWSFMLGLCLMFENAAAVSAPCSRLLLKLSNSPSVRGAATSWISSHFSGLDLLSEKQKKPILFAVSVFFERLELLGDRPHVYVIKRGQKLTELLPWKRYAGLTLGQVYPGLKTSQYSSMPMDELNSAEENEAIAVGQGLFTTSIQGQYNVFYHELGHLISYSFTPSEELIWRSLYEEALKKGLYLDGYGGTSAADYFAQGVEAFLSSRKNVSIRDPKEANTHDELKTKDPHLYAFILSLIRN